MDKRLAVTLYAEAKIMRGDLDKVEPVGSERPGRPGSGISAFILPFNNLLSRAQAAVSEDPIASQSLGGATKVEWFEEQNSPTSFHKQKKFELMTGLGSIMAVLEPMLSEASVIVPMRVTREGAFFAGEYYEPLRFASELITQARQSIVIIDGYLGDGQTVLDLLSGKATGVVVMLLTYEEKLAPSLLVLAQAFQKQHGGLSLRTSRAFHDRFVIIDDTDFFHFGASLKDMGTRGFMFSRIEEQEVVERVRTKFSGEWTKAMAKI